LQKKDLDYNLLNKINGPIDLKGLSIDDLLELSRQLRQFIIDEVSENPGHLGASLGVVELTIALHYTYNTPHDEIIWDVGHQAYGHKILTGRKKEFKNNRKKGGIAGFPLRTESEYDSYIGGHSSVSISAALGMAVASKQNNEDKKVVAVIGDGSMTGGVAFEGLNNAGIQNSDLLVILNDNNMAIDPNVGALSEYMLDITTSKTYNKLRDDVWNLLGILNRLGPNYRKFASKLEKSLKSMILKQSNLFESLNFRYFGPVDGHDLSHLNRVLADLKDIPGPKLLHCLTKKGKGLALAEENQTKYHAPGKFNKLTGEIIKLDSNNNSLPKFQKVFGETLLELAKINKNIVGITPAMPSGSSMDILMKEMPERTFDVGIAEQHAVSFSAGMATQGLIPFCNIYSTFMQRAYDQVIHDIAIQNLNVVLCLDRAGLVGNDGATHHGAYDIPYLRCVPNITFAAPMDVDELRNMMYTAQLGNKGPFAIRYPRGSGSVKNWKKIFEEIPIGKGRKLKSGHDLAILSIGKPGIFVSEAINEFDENLISIAHYDMRFIKPLDEELLHKIFKNFDKIITVEDGALMGGFGSLVLEFASENNYKAEIKRLGIPDKFISQAEVEEQYAECGFDKENIILAIKKFVSRKVFKIASSL
jgi:1-deoxy-D-xylulose-5-phosphate synthase